MAAKKPKGWRAFDKLAKGLASVDKTKVDQKIARDKAKRVKKRKKPKSSAMRGPLAGKRNICRYCGRPGARTIVAFGWAHKRCL